MTLEKNSGSSPGGPHPPRHLLRGCELGLESPSTADNQLFYGDDLEVLCHSIKHSSVDLIYLDPPFNSRQDYNVLFAEKDGTPSSSQITAFKDIWEEPPYGKPYPPRGPKEGKYSQRQMWSTSPAERIC